MENLRDSQKLYSFTYFYKPSILIKSQQKNWKKCCQYKPKRLGLLKLIKKKKKILARSKSFIYEYSIIYWIYKQIIQWILTKKTFFKEKTLEKNQKQRNIEFTLQIYF